MGNTDTLEYLIKHGASVNAIDHGVGGTPLTATIFGGKPDNARVLIEAGANAFHKVRAGRPLLHLAAQQGQREILELFLSAGVPVSTLDEIGETAAYWACKGGHLECIELLLLHDLDLKAGKVDLMKETIRQGHIPIVECLHKHGLPITEHCLYSHGSEDIGPKHWEMLYFISRHLQSRQADEGDTENESSDLMATVESLLSLGLPDFAAAFLEIGHRPGNLDDKSHTRLLIVCTQHGFLSGARALLSEASSLDVARKFSFEPHGWRLLEVAACRNDVEFIKLFLEHGWDPNREDTRGRTSLHLAALCGASDAVKELLCECNVHHRDKERNTAVHMGADSGSIQVLELLVTSREDLDKTNKAGKTPLGIACERGHANAVQWLLDHGSRDQIGDVMHLHPLQLSAHHDHVDCIDMLIASGSNVNTKLAGGNTPLHAAAMSGAWKAVSRLLQGGADPNCSNGQGMTPLAMALLQKEHFCGTFTELFRKSSVDWDAPMSQNIIFTSCVGGNYHVIEAVFDRLQQERPETAKKTVRRMLPELLAELCSSGLAARTAAFPFLLEYMHSNSKEVLSTRILVKAIQNGDDAKLAQSLIDINPKNIYLGSEGLWGMLHFACRYGRIKIARVLLANGAPSWAENENGLSPFEVAKKYLVGEALEEFSHLFRGYEAALTVLAEDDEALWTIQLIDMREKQKESKGKECTEAEQLGYVQ
ncbi:hypothetical protein N0V84_006002 [Fusarium piperis]|uniref:Ankyrin n=1 Tax=Fusarium piperis TaxID=1435070 RepID=A0A9W8WCL6_9HYPO|nr:hypothetical protein N0V84_006002 [Fusarium piperis]